MAVGGDPAIRNLLDSAVDSGVPPLDFFCSRHIPFLLLVETGKRSQN